jgi:hypothetical protein
MPFTTIADTNFNQIIFNLVNDVEVLIHDPYLDSSDIPTIGFGFNLLEKSMQDAVLNQLGFNLNTANPIEIQIIIDFRLAMINNNTPSSSTQALQNDLDQIMMRANNDNVNFPNVTSSKFTLDPANNDQMAMDIYQVAVSNAKIEIDKKIAVNGLTIDG